MSLFHLEKCYSLYMFNIHKFLYQLKRIYSLLFIIDHLKIINKIMINTINQILMFIIGFTSDEWP